MGRRETEMVMWSNHKNRFKKLVLFLKTQYLVAKLYIYKKNCRIYTYI